MKKEKAAGRVPEGGRAFAPRLKVRPVGRRS